MILYIKGADFSSANIGTLNTFAVRKSIGIGASYDIPDSVIKNTSVTWTITLADGYTFGNYSVTMGTTTITPSVNGNVMTINISSVTANIAINVVTVNDSTGDEVPEVSGGTSETIIFMEQELTDGFYAQGGALQSSNSHQHFAIPANNVKSITIRPDGIGTVAKLFYVIQITSDNKTIRMFDIMDDFSEGNMTKTIELENNTGNLYFNVFDSKKATNTYGYAREAIITYK